MKIVMACSEARPFCKTGGLADVTYSLSKELCKFGEEVNIFLPFYDSIKLSNSSKKVASFIVDMSWRKAPADVYFDTFEGINYFFIKNDQYFARGHLYGDFDDGERFAFFTLALKTAIEKIIKKVDIIHVHDWQCGMLPCLIKESNNSSLKNAKFIFTIHNPAFQGLYPKIILGDLYNLSDELFDSGKVRFKDQVSTLKTGIVYSDLITTVSPTHHLELLSEEGGMGLDNVLKLRQDDFLGILNGIDYLEFNPENDTNISKPFNLSNLFIGKRCNKKALLKQFNLKLDDAPIYSLVSRLTWQKGLDILLPGIEELANMGAKIIILGSGEHAFEEAFEKMRSKYPENIGIYIGYNDVLAHKIYAGSNFFLMPSLFEPCGLGQMIAQRYGTLPIVRRTGGLRDSVINYDGNNIETSNGFGFDDYNIYECTRTIKYAFETYNNKKIFNRLVKNAFNTDNSWVKSTKEYLKIYKDLVNKG